MQACTLIVVSWDKKEVNKTEVSIELTTDCSAGNRQQMLSLEIKLNS